jgi:hypothetical protein
MAEEELEKLHESYRQQAAIAERELQSRRRTPKTASREKAMAEG